MASKKDFSSIAVNSQLHNTITLSTSTKGRQQAAAPEEVARRQAEMKTQGRKGCKAPRINMAFSPDNHQFIKVLSKVRGETMTEFCNHLIEAYRTEHPELEEKAAEFINMFGKDE